ncbi:zf-CCHC domain-containing protein [Tanacetum coccineum]|uniref:Zf-CCHC domain-containing protein n=1 Tax=Tanacetum coccineum TaxID=301880 RepID=A0ABQ5C3G6_9ASTR
MAIEESKDLSSLALNELIGKLKVHAVFMEIDSEIYKGKKERIKSIALKAKKESSDDETSTSESDDEEYAMAVKNFKKCGDPIHLIGDCPKQSRNRDQKAFIGGSWSASENDAEDKTNDETCLIAKSSNEVFLRTCLEPDEWIKDSGCSKHMTDNKSLFSTYKAYDKVNVVFRSNLKGKIIGKGYSQNSKAYVVLNKHSMKVKESLNVTFNESPSPTKLSPLVDDHVGKEEAIKKNTKVVNNNNEEDESIEVDETVNIKESNNHPLDQFEKSMMGELNFFSGLQIKQMEDEIFFNQSKYIKEMLKKFRLEDSKPTKTPTSMEIKLTKDDEADSVDSFKYRDPQELPPLPIPPNDPYAQTMDNWPPGPSNLSPPLRVSRPPPGFPNPPPGFEPLP